MVGNQPANADWVMGSLTDQERPGPRDAEQPSLHAMAIEPMLQPTEVLTTRVCAMQQEKLP